MCTVCIMNTFFDEMYKIVVNNRKLRSEVTFYCSIHNVIILFKHIYLVIILFVYHYGIIITNSFVKL